LAWIMTHTPLRTWTRPAYAASSPTAWALPDVEERFITIMSYEDPLLDQGMDLEDIIHLPYFSNPRISYAGSPIGAAGEADAVRTINQTAGFVANYRPKGLWLYQDKLIDLR
jgi:hypothetical protein